MIYQKEKLEKIIEDNDENNDEFFEKILRSMKRNKNDKSSILTRKLGKYCKKESTENTEKIEQITKNYIYQMIKDL